MFVGALLGFLPQIRRFLILGFGALLGGFQDFCLLPLLRSAWFFATNGRIFFLCFEGFSSLLFSLDSPFDASYVSTGGA